MNGQGERMYEIESDGLLLVARQTQPAVATERDRSGEQSRLIEAVRQGDQDAFGRLYDLYAPMVHGIMLARVPVSDVDDLVQDVFLVAIRKLSTLRDENAFGGWLAMIARNRAMDFHRKHRETEELKESVAAKAEPGSDAEARRVLEAIRELPESYSETLILRLVEGMTGPEIALRTGLTPASVRVNLHRGMKLLREKLGLEG